MQCHVYPVLFVQMISSRSMYYLLDHKSYQAVQSNDRSLLLFNAVLPTRKDEQVRGQFTGDTAFHDNNPWKSEEKMKRRGMK